MLASASIDDALEVLGTSISGLDTEDAVARLNKCGQNVLSSKKPPTRWQLLLTALLDWFNGILVVIAIVNLAIPPPQFATFGVIVVMIVMGCIIRFWQEHRSALAAIKLQDGVEFSFRVRRRDPKGESIEMIVDQKDLVPGDLMFIDAGNTVPADCRVLHASNLSIKNEPQRKGSSYPAAKNDSCILELDNILLMGTSIISGSGIAVVIRTGDDAFLATIMKQMMKKRPQNAFQLGIKHLSWAMIAIIIVLFPIVLVVRWARSKEWIESLTFAVAVAVGLIPQLLPAIINSNLARGAFVLAKKNAIVKRLTSIQNLGSMTVLCSDKTGTLTKDEIALHHHVDWLGREDFRVYDLAHANAAAQSGTKNSIDTAILKHPASAQVLHMGEKIGEIAFNFESRRSSAILRSDEEKHLLICKGAYEEVLALCSDIRLGVGTTRTLSSDYVDALNSLVVAFNHNGYRVILVATKEFLDIDDCGADFDGLDTDMTLEGMLTFLDPPKDDAKASIARLQELGIDVRVLTGDNMGVALKICRELEIATEYYEDDIQAISGPDLAKLDDSEFHAVVKHCKVFAKLTPSQKGQVIASLREKHGEVVGMLGDGINDCIALRYADAGISVDTGANVAKDCADIILTKKELSIIVDSVIIGRTTQGNTIKYIKVVFSSNFGNILSVLIAVSWIPFQPMTGLQLLIGGLLYEISQLAIPWDSMDPEYLAAPTQWCVWDLLRFIAIQGPLSSLIDAVTFCTNWFFYKLQDAHNEAAVRTFQTHWYLQGLLTQVLIVHLVRTSKLPIIQSRPTKPLVLSSILVLVVGFALPYIPPIANAMQFTRPQNTFLGILVAEMAFYAAAVEIAKRIQLKVFKRWL
ncbi:Magnesium-transporting ATPase, P-type [Lachnellula willkommii]|uniref:Magnesium-transporting ATPase, P-type 1 n=1 Tax=Lachnellula willkommii TaxID=215461 RepID=A0A559MI81_9HELO|nr:Magnesium-transporting ATPase, P-type [Lachnellula willkommii]